MRPPVLRDTPKVPRALARPHVFPACYRPGFADVWKRPLEERGRARRGRRARPGPPPGAPDRPRAGPGPGSAAPSLELDHLLVGGAVLPGDRPHVDPAERLVHH